MNKKTKIIVGLALIIIILAGIKYIFQPSYQHLQKESLITANLVQGLQVFSEFKMASQMIFENTGKLATSNKQAGLASPEHYASQSIKSASIFPDGTIELIYTKNAGKDGGVIYFLPVINQGQIKWSCESPDYKRVYNLQCKYTGH